MSARQWIQCAESVGFSVASDFIADRPSWSEIAKEAEDMAIECDPETVVGQLRHSKLLDIARKAKRS